MDKFIGFDIDHKHTVACVVEAGQPDRYRKLRTDVAQLRESGFMTCLARPVSPSQLYNCLGTLAGRKRASPKEERTATATQKALEEDLKGKVRILVVEDNPINQLLALKFLEKLGYRADAVANGEEALGALREEYPVQSKNQ